MTLVSVTAPLHKPFRVILWMLWISVLVVSPNAAGAETRIEGNPKVVTVEVADVPLEEALAALSAALDMRIRTLNRPNKLVSGTYRGPLQKVVRRLLAGQDYVIEYAGGVVEVTILGPSDRSATASAGPAVPDDEQDLQRSPKAIRKDARRNAENAVTVARQR